ncbi:MAG: divergent polysaccharide deacetylase family protein [Desulfobacterales bacterium]|nr:divergent polysaccharide deacetylase family protein [Desulfobacterales bacterium]
MIGAERPVHVRHPAPQPPPGRHRAHRPRPRGWSSCCTCPWNPWNTPTSTPAPERCTPACGPDELLRVLEEDLRCGPAHPSGVNNHMGSRLTASSEQIYQVFSVLEKRGLYFVDSRTTDETICQPLGAAASSCRSPSGTSSSITSHEPAVSPQARSANSVRIAHRKGEAVGIAHPHPATLTPSSRKSSRRCAGRWRSCPPRRWLARRPGRILLSK